MQGEGEEGWGIGGIRERKEIFAGVAEEEGPKVKEPMEREGGRGGKSGGEGEPRTLKRGRRKGVGGGWGGEEKEREEREKVGGNMGCEKLEAIYQIVY